MNTRNTPTPHEVLAAVAELGRHAVRLENAMRRALPILRQAAAAEPYDRIAGAPTPSPAALAVDAAERALGIPNDNPDPDAAPRQGAQPGLSPHETRVELLRRLDSARCRRDLPEELFERVRSAYHALQHAHVDGVPLDARHLAETNGRAALAEVKAHDDNRTR